MILWRLKKQNISYKWADIFFKSVLIAFLYTIIFLLILHIFLKAIFYYVLTCSVKCFICCCFAFAELKCSCASPILMYLLPNTLYTMDFYKWKLNLIWSCLWIICKRLTKHTCWSIGMLLTCHIKFCMCNDSMSK